jgi:nucleoside diphosphate kinase
MKSVVILLLIVSSAFAVDLDAQRKDVVDFLLNSFGLGSVWTTIQSVGSNLATSFQQNLTQLLFAGQTAWNNAKPIFGQLVADLTNHVGDATTIVSGAVAQLAQVLASSGKRSADKDVVDFLLNSFGLGNIWTTVQQAGASLVAQFQGQLTQLLFAGQQAWNNAKPIFSQLVADLTNHAGDAVPLVSQAVAQLTQILSNSGKRSEDKSIVDFLVNQFGLSGVWTTIQSAGSNLLAQLQAELTQLLFSGQQILSQARPIFQQLVRDLRAHAENAVPLVSAAVTQLAALLNGSGKRNIAEKGVVDFLLNQFGLANVWSNVQQAGSNLVGQFQATLTQLLFAGQQAWNNAKPIFSQLVSDLTNHVGDASSIVAGAVGQLNQVLGQHLGSGY